MENDKTTPELELDENQNQEGQEDNQNDDNQGDDTQDQDQSEESQDEEGWKAEALKWKAIALRNKDKKPEAKVSKKSNELSQADVIAIIKNNVDEEDIPDVADFAKLKGITISEALKTPIVKTILKEKKEERNVAEATHTGVSRKGASKVSDETLLANARAGKMPDNEADMKRLIEARNRFK